MKAAKQFTITTIAATRHDRFVAGTARPGPRCLGLQFSTAPNRLENAELFPADPPHTKVDAVNIWYDQHDRYPSDTAWEPYGDDGWEWGRNFEHSAPADVSVAELADRVLATLKPRD